MANPAYAHDPTNRVIELKSAQRILPVHEAQTLTYPRPSGCKVGLLMNFNSMMLKDGLRRFVP